MRAAPASRRQPVPPPPPPPPTVPAPAPSSQFIVASTSSTIGSGGRQGPVQDLFRDGLLLVFGCLTLSELNAASHTCRAWLALATSMRDQQLEVPGEMDFLLSTSRKARNRSMARHVAILRCDHSCVHVQDLADIFPAFPNLTSVTLQLKVNGGRTYAYSWSLFPAGQTIPLRDVTLVKRRTPEDGGMVNVLFRFLPCLSPTHLRKLHLLGGFAATDFNHYIVPSLAGVYTRLEDLALDFHLHTATDRATGATVLELPQEEAMLALLNPLGQQSLTRLRIGGMGVTRALVRKLRLPHLRTFHADCCWDQPDDLVALHQAMPSVENLELVSPHEENYPCLRHFVQLRSLTLRGPPQEPAPTEGVSAALIHAIVECPHLSELTFIRWAPSRPQLSLLFHRLPLLREIVVDATVVERATSDR